MPAPPFSTDPNHKLSEAEALDNCEREPIELVGTIQPFGALLAVEPESDRIVYVSANIAEWLGHSAESLLGQKMVDYFSPEIIHQRNNALGHSTIEEQREVLGSFDAGDLRCEVFGHVRQGLLLVELQPAPSKQDRSTKGINEVHRCMSRLGRCMTLTDLLETAVEELRHYSGFDRVKAYRFLANGAGEVVAESRAENIDGFLGLRFPAFDIPQSARNLYAKTPIRVIASVTAEQVPVMGEKQPGDALDLSLALLRGLVPVHSMYLANMGVKATLSLPIVVEGKMWGLFAFHHYSERIPDAHVSSGLEMLGSSLSMMVSNTVQQAKLAAVRECARIAPALFVADDSPLGFSVYWQNAASGLASLLPCDGVALLSGETVYRYGACPTEEAIALLLPGLETLASAQASPSNTIALDELKAHFSHLDLNGSAGVLGLLHPVESIEGLLFFRNASSTQVKWAGNPRKNIERSNAGSRLHPRASFEAYQQESASVSDAFVEHDLMVADSLSAALSQALSRMDQQLDQRKRMGLVIRELNHRARNILTLARSMVRQTGASAENIDAFVHSLVNRFEAMSEIQSLLTEHEWKHVDLHGLVARGLGLDKSSFAQQVSLRGRGVGIPPDLASLLSMVLHELLSNALKYGALTTPTGRIEIDWSLEDGKLQLEWVERGGPPVKAPDAKGFGSALIQEALAYEFDAKCDHLFDPSGVTARFSIPMAAQSSGTGDALPGHAPSEPEQLRPFSALVLEDDFVIAREMKEMLLEVGANGVQAVSSIEGALKLLDSGSFDFAMLDANIHGQYSGPVAQRCKALRLPFGFATGYGSKDHELSNAGGLAVLTKPVQKNELIALLMKAGLGKKQS